MSDYLLYFRGKGARDVSGIAGLFRYYDDLRVKVYDYESFSLALSRPDDWNVWGPYESEDQGVIVALCGRIALEGKEWEEAKTVPGDGGLANKAIYRIYSSGKIPELNNLNGNFSVFIYDATKKSFRIIFDRCGMFPGFCWGSPDGSLVYCSHPDILAKYVGVERDFDLVSMAEFLIAGKLSHPYTYYSKIKSVDYGTVHLFDGNSGRMERKSVRKYFDFHFEIDPNRTEQDLAEELASSFGKAVNRRTSPLFGQTAISLSGGLDSRTILCSATNKQDIWTFCFFDEENLEYRTANKIARAAGVKFLPVKRVFDHYGDNAKKGIEISGGMGDFGSNHYLGFRESLKKSGIENVITGFYCDYLFKGLVLDKKTNKYFKHNSYSDFQYDNYMPVFWLPTGYSSDVRERLDAVFPDHLKSDQSDLGKLTRENRRIFPLCYEPDNQETLVPQRVMGWYLPIVDNDILNTYMKIPPDYKLNNTLYPKMVRLQCGEAISNIMDVNTGARVGASAFRKTFGGHLKYIRKKWNRRKDEKHSEESWPNWFYYLYNSENIHRMWRKESHFSGEILSELHGGSSYCQDVREFKGREIKRFLRLLTLKLWLENLDTQKYEG
jgi:asparagine synthase (glutamine-hydrolysing)